MRDTHILFLFFLVVLNHNRYVGAIYLVRGCLYTIYYERFEKFGHFEKFHDFFMGYI